LPQLEPLLPRATAFGAAAAREERATTGKRRVDARKNILPELRRREEWRLALAMRLKDPSLESIHLASRGF